MINKNEKVKLVYVCLQSCLLSRDPISVKESETGAYSIFSVLCTAFIFPTYECTHEKYNFITI